MLFRRFLTQSELEAAVEEAGQELYNYRKGALDAVYIPPDVDNVTDEEDVEDELLPEIDVPGPSDIAGTFELHAFMNEDDGAEIPNIEEAIFFDDDGFDTSDDEFLTSKKLRLVPPPVPVTSTTFAVPPLQPKWEKGPLEYTHSFISNADIDMEHLKNELAGKTPLEMFFLFFDDDLINLILDFSVKYAQQNNRRGFCLSKGELLNILGSMLFSGYHTLPQVPLYWSN
ncbi:unnamed protein product [Acanthoscelides obtectus]|uniref:PiggyBac transposable element-derived protein domain-containing protein n=1 Tax=Acanthoscelides obtectus TaxID=200917 RepID=A0A9P0JHW9_ACAOB|nr:unnamed protein product [Acanthoscelides obtectus]CAK1658136.1 PiggyBac transposable element-derived protein 2 [Acanthoscelides obtectus]